MTATLLDEATWRERQAAHEARVDGWTGGHLARRRNGVKHPVEDFLFTYYSRRPAQLRRWHPGAGVALGGAAASAFGAKYVAVPGGIALDVDALMRRRGESIGRIAFLLAATAARPAQLGCFGLHEWAMVYRQPQDEVRHNARPLRLGPEGVAEVVESHAIRCTHFDAFRFFTEAARPLNVVVPTRERQADLEQPGCLHANMDLYKISYKLSPLVPSELVADCFELAKEIRILDMRASPYDLTELGYSPVRVENAEGRQEYVQAQRSFAERAAVLRTRLMVECDRLLTSVPV